MATKRSTWHNVHVHSEYSTLDGVGFVEEYAEIARREGMGYLCITDHGMAAAWPQLIDVCARNGLRPVFGVELYVNDWHDMVPRYKSLNDEEKRKVRKNNHVLAIAENETGFNNLIKLVNLSWSKGFYGKPRVSTEQIEEHSEGLIATTGCLASPVNQELLTGNKTAARALLRHWSGIFPGRLWVEWMMIDMEDQDHNNKHLIQMAEDEGIPPLLTNDVHFALPDDYTAQCVQLAMRRDGTVDGIASHRLNLGWSIERIAADLGMDHAEVSALAASKTNNPDDDEREEIFQLDTDKLWFSTESEMEERFASDRYKYIPRHIFEESIEQSLILCQRCGYVYPDRSPKLPEVENADEELLTLCWKSLKQKGLSKNKEYMDRLNREFDVIQAKGFSSYFLITHRIINLIIECNGDPAPGRGSVGGCLIAWLLGITDIDPIHHKTLFERFMSYSRGGKIMRCSLH